MGSPLLRSNQGQEAPEGKTNRDGDSHTDLSNEFGQAPPWKGSEALDLRGGWVSSILVRSSSSMFAGYICLSFVPLFFFFFLHSCRKFFFHTSGHNPQPAAGLATDANAWALWKAL